MGAAPGRAALISCARVTSSAGHAAKNASDADLRRLLVPPLALLFLLANLAARLLALRSSGPSILAVAGVVVAVSASCLFRGAWLGPLLAAFGGSFFLSGFHSYNIRSQLFELALAALGSVLVIRFLRTPRAPTPPGLRTVLPFAVLFALGATFSLLLLPSRVLEHRAFLEGIDLPRAALSAFPKDPLYPIASVNRLWLFLAFIVSLAAQPDGPLLYRRLVRGVAWSAVAAVAVGLLDFAGIVSLAPYNLSQVFFGSGYRRLQSTFGNPSWFACFVACVLPFVLLEWTEARRSSKVVTAAFFPLAAASLFLSGARASWLAGLVMLLALAGLRGAARRAGRALPGPSRLGTTALAASVAVFGLLAINAFRSSESPSAGASPGLASDRLEGLSREVRIRGLGLTSSRRVAAEYALELAKERPLLGLGYESFNIHLRAQLALPGSPVARVVNTAVAADPTETVFDDSHNTWLQVLVGMGALGLALWLALAAVGLTACVLTFLRSPGPESLALSLGMLLFHFYGLFQGMAYIPVIYFLFFVELGYTMSLAVPAPAWLSRASRTALVALGALLLVTLPVQAVDRGHRSLKRALGIEAYLPDEAAEFEGFYAPEAGPDGAFRWMPRRGIVNVEKAAPFRLAFTCAHPDLEREPVVVSLHYEGKDVGAVVCRRPGTQDKRFAPGKSGALRIVVSRTFQPADDRRELGVAVSAIRWE
jgi:hypothetical protein